MKTDTSNIVSSYVQFSLTIVMSREIKVRDKIFTRNGTQVHTHTGTHILDPCIQFTNGPGMGLRSRQLHVKNLNHI